MDSEEIEFPPNPRAIGIDNPNFTRPVDALAEIVDNAIQAYSNALTGSDYRVHIQIYVNAAGDSGFLTVSDDGQGMNTEELRGFATFASSREDRQLQPQSADDVLSLSKFGVGGKQGGFSLGDHIGVFTKSATDRWKEFHLNAPELLDKVAQSQGNPYLGTIRHFASSDLDQLLDYGEKSFPKLVRDMKSHMELSESGTIFLVRLKTSTLHEMFRTGWDEFVQDLAQIYFFHLHPQFQASNEKLRSGHYSQAAAISQAASERDAVAIEVTLNRLGESSGYSQNLSKVMAYSKQAFDNEFVLKLPFQMIIPADIISAKEHCIHGIVLYFPCTRSGESKPTAHDHSDIYQEGPVVHVCWQYRILPEALYSNMPFFPVKRKSPLLQQGLSDKWTQRTVAYLFLEWDFPHISNNKLKVNLSDFDTLLCTHKKHLRYHPSSFKSDFDRWICECGKQDFEFSFANRVDTGITSSNVTFTRLSITNRAMTIDRGDFVRIEHDKKAYSEIGQIVSFLVTNDQVNKQSNSYVGQNGFVKYHRLPERLYGGHEETTKVSLLKFYKLNNVQLQKEQEEILKLKPDKIDLFKLLDNNEIEGFSSHSSTVLANVPQTLLVRILQGRKECYLAPNSDNLRFQVKLTAASNTWSIITDTDSLFSLEGQRKKYLRFPNVIFPENGSQSLKVEVFPYDGTEPTMLDLKINLVVKQNAATQMRIRETPMIARLGAPVSSMTFELLDANDRIIALSSGTEVRLELICDDPLLKIAGPPMIAVSSINNGMILKTAPFMWKIEPQSSSTPVFGGDRSVGSVAAPPQPKDVVLMCILHFGPFDQLLLVPSQAAKTYSQRAGGAISGSSSRQLAISSTSPSSSSARNSNKIESAIQVRLYPGNPARLLLHDPPPAASQSQGRQQQTLPELNLKANDPIPHLTFWCVDSLNNRTMPIVESKEQWRVTLSDEYPLTFASKREAKSMFVREHGEVVFDRLLSTYTEPLLERGKAVQAINLLREDGHAISGFTPLQLTINLLPDEYPCQIQVYHNQTNKINTTEALQVEAGAILDSLFVRIISDLNRVMKVPPSTTVSCYFEGSNVTSSGSSKGKKRSKPQLADDGRLEPVTAPKAAGAANLIIEIYLDSLDSPLTESITMEILPGPPKYWKIVVDPSFNLYGLQLRNSVDLYTKVKGVALVDQFENVIPKLSRLLATPVLVVQQQDLGAKNTQQFALVAAPSSSHQRGASSDENGVEIVHFVLLPSDALTDLPQDCQVTLTVVDSRGLQSYETFKVLRTEIISLLPSRLVFSSDSYDLIDENDHFEVTLHSFDEITDLHIGIVDDLGEACSDRWTKKMSAELIANDHDVVWSTKKLNNQNPIHIDTAIKLHELQAVNHNKVILTVDVTCHNRHHDPDRIQLTQQLHVTIKRLGNVERLDLAFRSDHTAMDVDGNDNEDDGDSNKAKTTVIAGEAIAPLVITIITADSSPFVPSRDSFTFQVLNENKEEIAIIKDQLLKTELPGQMEIALPPLQIAGEYTLHVLHTEQREELQHLPKDSLIVHNEAVIIVEASKPTQLFLDDSKGKINETVMQTEKENDRLIGKNLVFEVKDIFENRVNSLAAYQLTCTITALNNARTRVLPILQTFDRSGIESTVAKTDRAGHKSFVFSSLLITNGAGEPPVPDGDFVLLFELKKSDHDQELLAYFSQQFSFKSRLTMSTMVAQEEAKSEAARRELARYKDAKVQMDKHENELSVIENAYETAPELVGAIKSREMNRLQELTNLIEDKVIAIEGRTRRPATVGTLPSCPRTAIGYVVKLAYVADEQDAKVISWAMESNMNALIVQTQDEATKLYQSKQRKVWAVESALPFPNPPADTGELIPETSLGVGQDAHYMLNMIDPIDEEHRKTIFWQALKNNILAKDIATAQVIRDRCLRSKRQPPLIFTRQGERWSTSGMMDPGQRMPQNLNFVFGEREPRSSAEYLTCQRTLDDCLKAKDHLQQMLPLREEINTVDVDELKRQVLAADRAKRSNR